jgi:hypothetical protein
MTTRAIAKTLEYLKGHCAYGVAAHLIIGSRLNFSCDGEIYCTIEFKYRPIATCIKKLNSFETALVLKCFFFKVALMHEQTLFDFWNNQSETTVIMTESIP